MTPTPDANDTLAQIQRIVQSKAFRTSELQRNLLSYLADKSLQGTADDLKEYTVGLDVFAKPASYDPRQESVVRMHVGRLRQKIGEYYRTEGTADPIVVDLPKGGFKVTFEPRQLPADAPAVGAGNSRRQIALLAACLVLALTSAGYLGIRLWRAERQAAAAIPALTPELQTLWAPLLSSSRPLMVCLDSPAHGVTGAGTASGAFLLGQFLAQRKQNVVLTTSDSLSVTEIAMGDMVFLGPGTGNRPLRAISGDLQLVLEKDGIRNLRPRAGEPAFIPDVTVKDGEVEATHALISHLAGPHGVGEVLYLSSNHISGVMGAVQAFTDPGLARTLVAKMRVHNGAVPRYYQVVLKVNSMDDMPLEITYVMHRELAPDADKE
jgi:hypothetical protein